MPHSFAVARNQIRNSRIRNFQIPQSLLRFGRKFQRISLFIDNSFDYRKGNKFSDKFIPLLFRDRNFFLSLSIKFHHYESHIFKNYPLEISKQNYNLIIGNLYIEELGLSESALRR